MRGANILQKIENDDDPLHGLRVQSDNIFYPFHSRAEWQVANWTNLAGLSVSQIDGFLKLDAVSNFCGNMTQKVLIIYRSSKAV